MLQRRVAFQNRYAGCAFTHSPATCGVLTFSRFHTLTAELRRMQIALLDG